MIRLSIPKPCHETWAQMTPDEDGRFCLSCSKHVIDFSEMSDAELADYFLKNTDKQICGRYRNEQLNLPLLTISEAVFYKTIPVWQKFLAILLIVFSTTLFGCKSELRPIDKISDVPVRTTPLIKEKLIVSSQIASEAVKEPASKKNRKKQLKETLVFNPETMIMGWTNTTFQYPKISPLPDGLKYQPSNQIPLTTNKNK